MSFRFSISSEGAQAPVISVTGRNQSSVAVQARSIVASVAGQNSFGVSVKSPPVFSINLAQAGTQGPRGTSEMVWTSTNW